MKLLTRILPLLLVLTGCATTELPERSRDELPSAEVFQGANVILVEMDGDTESIRERIIQALRSETFSISTPTLQESTIATEPKTFGSGVQGSARYFLDLPATEGEPVRLYALMIEQNVGDRNAFQQFRSFTVTPGGQRLSLSWYSWITMNDLARVLASGDIMYDRA